jgi:hypothetical protein
MRGVPPKLVKMNDQAGGIGGCDDKDPAGAKGFERELCESKGVYSREVLD